MCGSFDEQPADAEQPQERPNSAAGVTPADGDMRDEEQGIPKGHQHTGQAAASGGSKSTTKKPLWNPEWTPEWCSKRGIVCFTVSFMLPALCETVAVSFQFSLDTVSLMVIGVCAAVTFGVASHLEASDFNAYGILFLVAGITINNVRGAAGACARSTHEGDDGVFRR